MEQNTLILNQFKRHLIQFLDELIGQFPESGDLIILRFLFNDKIPIQTAIEKFSHNLLTSREYIAKRDDSFFTSRGFFISFAEADTTNNLRSLWISNRLDAEDRIAAWKWIDSLVCIADKYQSLKKNVPTKVNVE